MMMDAVLACADLVGRAGAKDFQIGFLNEEATTMAEAGWYATAKWRGTRFDSGPQQSPELAAMALATRVLKDADCRCGQTVTLADDEPGCRWQLVGREWKPGCDVPPITVVGQRGDLAAMRRAMQERHEETRRS